MKANRLKKESRVARLPRRGKRPSPGAVQPGGANDQFRLLVEGVKDYAIFMLDPTGVVISWNAGAERIKGYTAEEIIGQHFSRFYPQEDIERGQPARGLAGATAEGRFEDEAWRLRKDGSCFLANVVITALRDQAGRLRGFAKVTRDITERKRTEATLLAAEATRCAVWESSLDAIVVMDEQGNIADFNPAAEKMFGYRLAEILGQPLADKIVPPMQREGHRRGMARFLATGQSQMLGRHIELQAMRADGSEFPVELTVVTVIGASPPRFIGTIRDITGRKQVEAAMRQSESRLQTMMDNSPAVIFIKDLTGRYLQVNRQFEKMFGLTHNAILGRTDLEIFPREQAEAYRAHDAQVMQKGGPCQFEEVARYVNGEHVNIVSKFPLLDDAGKACALCGMAIDISERKQAEESLRRARFTLQSIFDATPVAVLSLDLEGRITHWSRGAERMFGWMATEVHARICPTVPPDGLEDFHTMLARVVRDGPETGLVRYRQKKSGERIHASLCPAPLRDADGKIVGVTVILEDVTERVRAQQTLKDHSTRLARLSRQLLHAQEDERRHIARELHDQMGQALTLLQIGLQSTQALAEAPTMARELEHHITATEQILEQVRNLSLDLRPSMLDDLGLVPALRWYADRVGRAARIEIHFEARSVTGQLPADIETACFRTAQEALTNVLRHARARSAQIQLGRENDTLVLTVRDDGCGFDLAGARQRASSGGSMGLITMEERVMPMGGSLTLESSPGNGTILRATFPLPTARSSAA